MGTRNLTMVILDGKTRVSQYCQWDGYINGQGLTVHEFLTNPKFNKEKFKKKIRATKEIDEKEFRKRWNECGADPNSDMVTLEVEDKFKKKYPQLQRDLGAKVLPFIYSRKLGVELQLNKHFAADSLYCEYAYVIDLDKNTFEIYKGFNYNPLTKNDRFYFLQKKSCNKGYDGTKYYPIRLMKQYDLDNIPSEEIFLKECEKEETYKRIVDELHDNKDVKLPDGINPSDIIEKLLSNIEKVPTLLGLNEDLDKLIEEKLGSKN